MIVPLEIYRQVKTTILKENMEGQRGQRIEFLSVFTRGGHSRGYPIDLLIDFLYGTVGRN
jgi:hypothetical protein